MRICHHSLYSYILKVLMKWLDWFILLYFFILLKEACKYRLKNGFYHILKFCVADRIGQWRKKNLELFLHCCRFSLDVFKAVGEPASIMLLGARKKQPEWKNKVFNNSKNVPRVIWLFYFYLTEQQRL